MAPLEGITTYLYRNAVESLFPKAVDKFFAPFIRPHIKCAFNTKEERDLLPANNAGLFLVPQILTDNAEDYLRYEQIFLDLGYTETNLNLGCPSPTVSSKGRGAGFLGRPEDLDRFLDTVYGSCRAPVSIKTRIGISDPDEAERLLQLFNHYPISELIVHPRLLKELYKGLPHREVFLQFLRESKNPLVYNGDLWTMDDVSDLLSDASAACPGKSFDLMFGRGAIANPAIFRQIRGGRPLQRKELRQLVTLVEEGYREIVSGETPVLFRMKEMWTWLIRLFPDNSKSLKKLLKCRRLSDFHAVQEELISMY